MGEGSARASSIVCPVSATIQTCLNAACAGAVDESPESGVLPLSDPESPDVELSGVEVWGVEVSGAELAGAEVSAVELSAVEVAGGELSAGGAALGCDGARAGEGCAAGPAGGGATTIIGARAAEASVASACGPATVPAAMPKPRTSRVATPATRVEGSGHAVARRAPAVGGAAGGAASALRPRASASGSSRGGPRRSPQLRQ